MTRPLLMIAAVALCAFGAARAGAEENLVAGKKASGAVTVRDVKNSDGSISGVLVNKTSRQLRDIRLMVHHTWHWKDELHPGDDNPGRVEYYTVTEPLGPNGTANFRYKPSPPLPVERTDGRFDTTLDVVGYTEIGH
jgi:hypothetical protein